MLAGAYLSQCCPHELVVTCTVYVDWIYIRCEGNAYALGYSRRPTRVMNDISDKQMMKMTIIIV